MKIHVHEALVYEACNCTHMSLHVPKTLETSKKKARPV